MAKKRKSIGQATHKKKYLTAVCPIEIEKWCNKNAYMAPPVVCPSFSSNAEINIFWGEKFLVNARKNFPKKY